MASFRKRGKTWFFRYVDGDGIARERKGCSDKRATEELARDAESEAARVRAGLLDPRELARRAHQARPLAEHLDAWHAHLLAKGDTPKHASLFVERSRIVVALVKGGTPAELIDGRTTKAGRDRASSNLVARLGKARLADLDATRVQDALSSLRAHGLSLQTVNHHRSAIRGFAHWAWKDGRLRDDPLAGVVGYNVKEDRRHDRRTLGLDELRRLIEAAHAGPAYRQMTGPARSLCYRLAVATGLRKSEIESITPESLNLAGPAPTVTVEAGYTKNGDPATLPLPADVAADLAAFVAGMSPGTQVFPLPDKAPPMLQIDLAAAGIPYRDSAGLVFDFHALRCQMATLLDAAGVTPRVVQKQMRHSTLELTGRYTRPRAVDLERAAGSLPSLRPTPAPATEPTALAATGTDDQPISKPLAHYLPTGGDGTGPGLTTTEENTPSSPALSMGRKPLDSTGVEDRGGELTTADESTPGRIRTCGLRFRKPPDDSPKGETRRGLRLAPPPLAHHLPIDTCPTDLALVNARWPDLPEPIRAAIVAMVKASSGG